MTLDAGDAGCTSGLSKRVFDYRVAAASEICLTDDKTALKADCFAIAQAVVDEITANAEAVVSIATAGLQTSTAPGAPTAPPAPTEQTIPIR
jgi:hypothetical protein